MKYISHIKKKKNSAISNKQKFHPYKLKHWKMIATVKWNESFSNEILLNILLAFCLYIFSNVHIRYKLKLRSFILIVFQYKFIFIRYIKICLLPPLIVHKPAYIFLKRALLLQLCLIQSLTYPWNTRNVKRKRRKWLRYHETRSLPVITLFLLSHLLLSQQRQSKLVKWN